MRRPSGLLIPNAAQSRLESVCGERVPAAELAGRFPVLQHLHQRAASVGLRRREFDALEVLRCRAEGESYCREHKPQKERCFAFHGTHLFHKPTQSSAI